MKTIIKNLCSLILAALMLSTGACKKFLDEKPDKKIATPQTLDDLEGLLENYSTLNTRFPAAAEISADNYYLNDAGWSSASEFHRTLYIWNKFDEPGGEWSSPYNNIFYANLLLESINEMNYDISLQQRANQVKGEALFLRAINLLALAQLFAPPYNKNTAATDPGLPLRLNTDYNEISRRASVSQTYEQIITDIKLAVPLLSAQLSKKYRPSRPAAYALLARTFLIMQNYPLSGLYADSCLQLYNNLLDYNSVSPSATIPFPQFHSEVIYDCRTAPPAVLAQTRAKVDTTLYQSYHLNDCRRTVFFRANSDGSFAFKGNYTGLNTAALFTGIATDEVWLTRAEALARNGNSTDALNDLNTLLQKRWKPGTFTPLAETDPSILLKIILEERRKQLLFRTIRWFDLRRLNLEQEHATILKRTVNGQQYELMPGSPRYTLQIPQRVIQMSGMMQNP